MLVIISTPSKEVLNFDVMVSIVPGYEYDIFISYRQKDNKYDSWVTEFVDNLKRDQINKVANAVKEIMLVSQFPYFLHVKVNTYLGNIDEAFVYPDKAVTEKNESGVLAELIFI